MSINFLSFRGRFRNFFIIIIKLWKPKVRNDKTCKVAELAAQSTIPLTDSGVVFKFCYITMYLRSVDSQAISNTNQ